MDYHATCGLTDYCDISSALHTCDCKTCLLYELLVLRRESSSSVKLFKNFKESNAIKTNFAAEALSGGSLLGIRGSDFVCFYDWASGKVSLHA